MKFEHLSSAKNNNNNNNNKKKKSYFTFEIQSLSFLNFTLKNVLHIKSNFNDQANNVTFKESKNSYTFFFFILLFVFFVILFVIDQYLLNCDNTNLLLIIDSQAINSNLNNCFNNCNLFFNDLLINIVQELE